MPLEQGMTRKYSLESPKSSRCIHYKYHILYDIMNSANLQHGGEYNTMNESNLRSLLTALQEGKCDVEQTLERLRLLPYEDLGFAKVDHHRQLRNGFPEVIYCPGKTPQQVTEIIRSLLTFPGNILATRAEPEVFSVVQNIFPAARYHALPRMITIERDRCLYGKGTILVVSAGTADLPVAEEACLTAQLMGNTVERLYDVGVAGIHRLLDNKAHIFRAAVIIVVAGMDGALPSVVGGMVSCPVIAVPTSAGYGASFNGLAPLLTMLNSCAAGVSVVNIDNGFGAGYSAALINRTREPQG
jgi:pyridinium-3,5-biscarboxylic acid mononucleotide synthase